MEDRPRTEQLVAHASCVRVDRRRAVSLAAALLATVLVAGWCGVTVAQAAGSSPKGAKRHHKRHAPPSAADRASARRIATLQRQAHALSVQLDAAQSLVLQQQLASQSVDREQSRVRGLVTNDIVQMYQHGGDPDAGTLLLSAGNLDSIVHVTQVTRQFAKWRTGLQAQFDDVQVHVADQRHQADRAMGNMVTLSHRLDAVNLKLDVESGRVAQRKATRVARATAGAALPNLGGTAQLVAAGGATVPTTAGNDQGGVVDAAYVLDTTPAPGFGGMGSLISIGQGMIGGGAVTSTSAQQIDLYLMGKGSPMAGAGALFIEAGQKYGLDPRLVVAISGAESTFGTITCGSFNAWGWGCPNSPGQFASWGDGIDTVARGLRTGYVNEGRTTVSAIHEKYAPVGAANDPTGLNNNWVTNVSKFLGELGGNPNSIATQAFVDVPAAPSAAA